VRWRYHAEKPVVAGVTPTAGGVTFTGDLNGNFLVFNSKTGALVYQTQTGGALAGGVVTYEVAGRQYVAFASGNVSRLAFGALGLPSVVVMSVGGKSASASPAAGSSQGRGTAGRATESAEARDLPPAVGRARSKGSAQAADAPAGTPLARGRKLYAQVCTTCHGLNGNFVAGHELSTLRQRRDLDATIQYIKDPKPPMPKLYPALLDDQAVADVATYVQQEIAH
jgi:alcohol dehydrogenase (cytochrome c)